MRAALCAGMLCVGASVAAAQGKAPAKAPGKAPTASATVNVYAYDRGGLAALYCSTGGALASGAPGSTCKLPASLTLTVAGKRITVARKIITREGMADSFKLTWYKLPRGKRAPIVVVQSRAGISVWEGALDDVRDGIAIPGSSPTLGLHKSGFSTIGTPTVMITNRQRPVSATITVTSEGNEQTISTSSWTEPVVLATLDIDGDGKTEVITLQSDDGGPRVTVQELDDAVDEPFRADVGG